MGQVITVSGGNDYFEDEVAKWNLQTDLASESSVYMDGSTEDLRPGVTGILPIEHGGTGNATGNAASATKMETTRTIRTNLASTATASFDGTANVTPGVFGTLPVSNGGTGTTSLTSGAALIGNGTGAVTTRSITNLTAKGAVTASTNLVTANTVQFNTQARLNRTTSVNGADTGYTTYMARGIALVTSVPSSLTNGCCAFVYS